MDQKQFLIRGTFLLTAAGMISRLIGFFYRIFLSRTIGAEGMGIYQLIQPVLMFCMAVSSGGIQTAISRFCAEYCARKDSKRVDLTLAAGLTVSIFLSSAAAILLFTCSDTAAVIFLAEPRSAPLLRIAAFSLPFAVIHACFGGYFTGIRQIRVPAAAQLAEQLLRIGTVFFLYHILQKNGAPFSLSAVALGQVAGELASALLCTLWYLSQKTSVCGSAEMPKQSTFSTECRNILSVSVPLSLNRMLICVLQGIEAALLPRELMRTGISSSEALSLYGTMSGMALPLLLFPTSITNALGSLLLPAVSEARVMENKSQLAKTVQGSFFVSFLLGIFCFSAFTLFGSQIGVLLFASPLAGTYIWNMAWLCPFMYLNGTLVNILHGMGKTFAVSLQNTTGFLGRLAAVLFLVPVWGMQGYFAGLFLSQFFLFGTALYTLHKAEPLCLPIPDLLLKPLSCSILGILGFWIIRKQFPYFSQNTWGALVGGGLIFTVLFFSAALIWILQRRHKV